MESINSVLQLALNDLGYEYKVFIKSYNDLRDKALKNEKKLGVIDRAKLKYLFSVSSKFVQKIPKLFEKNPFDLTEREAKILNNKVAVARNTLKSKQSSINVFLALLSTN